MVYNWLATNFMPDLITFALSLIVLLIGSITDLKTREVPDWVNYGLIGTGFTVWFLYAIISSEWSFFVNSLIGFGAFFIFALIMFYSGQWGGGDSKMIMGLGALIGLDISFKQFPFILSFFINTLLVGAAYGFIWSFVLAIKNWRAFFKKTKEIFANRNIVRAKWFILGLIIAYMILFFIMDDYLLKLAVSGFILVAILTFYLWIFVKAIEQTCMYKYVAPEKLTEGDWIAKPVKYKGKVICSPKDLGILKKQITLLKRYKIEKVLIKEGIPFVPSFLMAFLVSIYLLYFIPRTLGNLIFLFL